MASPPSSRNDFEMAIVCALPLEYNAVSILFDNFWDETGDRYGRAAGDPNTYTTGRMGGFDIVLVLLPNMGKVSAAGAAASLRSSYPEVRLLLLTGICGGVPTPGHGQEILLGDVVISKTVIQYDLGRQYPDGFLMKDTTEDSLGRPTQHIRNFVVLFETDPGRERLEAQASVFLQQIQDQSTRKGRPKYQYPGTASDWLFEAHYPRKHHLSPQCICATSQSQDLVCDESRNLSCDELGCDTPYRMRRERLETKKKLEDEGRVKEAQAPSIFVGRFGSGDKVLKSGEEREKVAKRHGILAFEMEGAGAWSEIPCIVIKGVCDYADNHKNKIWQDFAAATAASVTKSMLERYPHTDKSSVARIQQPAKFTDEDKACLKDLRSTDPRDDKTSIHQTKGGLLRDSYRWILDHVDFRQWRDDPQYRLLWIKGDPGKGKTMLLCGIIDEMPASYPLSYFFCRATEAELKSSGAVLRGLIYLLVMQQPCLISHIREKYDCAGKQLFEDRNAWAALSTMLISILKDPRSKDAVLIIDALDECKGEELPRLLDFIYQVCSSYPIKWIVSSRNGRISKRNSKHSPRRSGYASS